MVPIFDLQLRSTSLPLDEVGPLKVSDPVAPNGDTLDTMYKAKETKISTFNTSK
jgi:hypothetical protein